MNVLRNRIINSFLVAVLSAVFLFCRSAHAQFVIKNPTVEEGELAFVDHGSYESALPAGGDPLGWGHEVEVGYGFTDFWKSTLVLDLKQPVHEELELNEGKFENYLELADYAPWGAVFTVFGAVDCGLDEGVANAAKFGPLAKFGDDDLSLTLNAIFDKTFGKYRTPGTGLKYAAQVKFALADGLSLGGELFGDITNIEDVPSFNDTEFRVGPVLYLSWGSEQSHFSFTGDVGILLGTTDATPDTTVKWDLELTLLTFHKHPIELSRLLRVNRVDSGHVHSRSAMPRSAAVGPDVSDQSLGP